MIVYIYTFPNGKKYIGQTTLTLEKRAREGSGYSNQLVGYAIQKYGWNNIQKEIIECQSEEEMDNLERELIIKYKTQDRKFGYNLESGGHLNKHHSEKTKKKISESHKGLKPSKETREKISKIHKGKYVSEETKKKLSESHKGQEGYWKGKKLSKEHKQHISEALKGKTHESPSLETREKMSRNRGTAVICLETKEIYPSGVKASKAIGLNDNAVGDALRGRNQTAGGFHWMKFDDYEKTFGDK